MQRLPAAAEVRDLVAAAEAGGHDQVVRARLADGGEEDVHLLLRPLGHQRPATRCRCARRSARARRSAPRNTETRATSAPPPPRSSPPRAGRWSPRSIPPRDNSAGRWARQVIRGFSLRHWPATPAGRFRREPRLRSGHPVRAIGPAPVQAWPLGPVPGAVVAASPLAIGWYCHEENGRYPLPAEMVKRQRSRKSIGAGGGLTR